tara:strand:+ start:98 stop:316 length:219 start_codon:yes stop_codon:yes gene_type:complete
MTSNNKSISKTRRVSILMVILWIPISIMLSMIGVFGDYQGERAVIFWFAGEFFWIILAILGPWIGKAFSTNV